MLVNRTLNKIGSICSGTFWFIDNNLNYVHYPQSVKTINTILLCYTLIQLKMNYLNEL